MAAARRLVVEADGGSRGNPGPAGYGALVRDAETREVLAERAASVGVTTNNVAEYSGLLAGLEAAAEVDALAEVEVRMDSKLVVEQMSGRWQVKHEDMRRLADRARAAFPPASVRYTWVPRAENSHADRLANEAMDAAARGSAWEPRPEEPGAGAPGGLQQAPSSTPEVLHEASTDGGAAGHVAAARPAPWTVADTGTTPGAGAAPAPGDLPGGSPTPPGSPVDDGVMSAPTTTPATPPTTPGSTSASGATAGGEQDRLAYRLLTGTDDRAFCEKVSRALAEGYELHGGPAVAVGPDGVVVTAQAVRLPAAPTARVVRA